MSAATKLAEVAKDPPIPDYTKPFGLRWWRLPQGEFQGTISDGFVAIGSAVNDGVDISGRVESLWMLPSGVCLAGVRVSAPSGTLRWLLFKNGHGAPL